VADSGPAEDPAEEAPLEREELTLPDGRRVILYTRVREEE
jgi:hypothetical protein